MHLDPCLSHLKHCIASIAFLFALHASFCASASVFLGIRIVLRTCIYFPWHLHRFACVHSFSFAFASFCVPALFSFAFRHVLHAALFYLHIACNFASFCMPALFSFASTSFCVPTLLFFAYRLLLHHFACLLAFSSALHRFPHPLSFSPCMLLALHCLSQCCFIACIYIRAMMLTT